MKRPPSSFPDHTSFSNIKPNITKMKTTAGNSDAKLNGSSPSPKKKVKSTETSSNSNMNEEWDREKRERFMDGIIALGYKSANLDEMADRLGLSKRQLINQLTLGRNNLRSKAVAAVREG